MNISRGEADSQYGLNRIGTVSSVSDGVCLVSGLVNVKLGEIVYIGIKSERVVGCTPITIEKLKRYTRKLVSFEERFIRGLVLNLNADFVSLIVLGNERLVSEGSKVFSISKRFKIKTSLSFFGHVLNSLGDIIDGVKTTDLSYGISNGNLTILLKSDENINIIYECDSFVEQKAKGILDREPVRKPLLTGLTSVDSLVPIGRGQRELIIGDRQTGKTSVAVDVILNHVAINNLFKYEDKMEVECILSDLRNMVWFVYCGIGQKQSSISNLRKKLVDRSAMWYTAIVSATSSESAPLQFLAPYVACTLGEFVRDWIGGHSVIIFDDLSKHAVAYRQMSLLLRRPPGREAFPGDVFYVHSRLLERAGALRNRIRSFQGSNGGFEKLYRRGTLTAFPIIETQAGDVSAYIPTNVISITDGQIFLESELFYRGIRPAVNVGLSVSRVGSAAQPNLMKNISGSLKMELAQFREVENFAKLGADLDEHTKKLLIRGTNLIEILKQDVHSPLSTFVQSISIFTGVGFSGKFVSRLKLIRDLLVSRLGYSISTRNVLLPHFFNTKFFSISWLEYLRLRSVMFEIGSVREFLTSLAVFLADYGVTKLFNYASVSEVSDFFLFKFPVFINDLVVLYFLEFGAGYYTVGSTLNSNLNVSPNYFTCDNVGEVVVNEFLILSSNLTKVSDSSSISPIEEVLEVATSSTIFMGRLLRGEILVSHFDKFKIHYYGGIGDVSMGDFVIKKSNLVFNKLTCDELTRDCFKFVSNCEAVYSVGVTCDYFKSDLELHKTLCDLLFFYFYRFMFNIFSVVGHVVTSTVLDSIFFFKRNFNNRFPLIETNLSMTQSFDNVVTECELIDSIEGEMILDLQQNFFMHTALNTFLRLRKFLRQIEFNLIASGVMFYINKQLIFNEQQNLSVGVSQFSNWQGFLI